MRLTEDQLGAAYQLLHDGKSPSLPLDRRDVLLGVITSADHREGLIDLLDQLLYGDQKLARDMALDLAFTQCRMLAYCFMEGDE